MSLYVNYDGVWRLVHSEVGEGRLADILVDPPGETQEIEQSDEEYCT